jgi:hypothetical protein
MPPISKKLQSPLATIQQNSIIPLLIGVAVLFILFARNDGPHESLLSIVDTTVANNNVRGAAASSPQHLVQSLYNPLGIPEGEAANLPSIRVKDSVVDKSRKIYGGAGDMKHLGGFTKLDLQGVSQT